MKQRRLAIYTAASASDTGSRRRADRTRFVSGDLNRQFWDTGRELVTPPKLTLGISAGSSDEV